MEDRKGGSTRNGQDINEAKRSAITETPAQQNPCNSRNAGKKQKLQQTFAEFPSSNTVLSQPLSRPPLMVLIQSVESTSTRMDSTSNLMPIVSIAEVFR
jgi:hypothetical protein